MVKLGNDDGTMRTGEDDAGHAPARSAVLAFGDLELDVDRFELRRGGVRVAVQPKPLALLLFLARQRERLVPREEVVAHLWPDVVVSDDALFHALKVAREAVGDRGRHQRVIETVRGVGFRFVAPVEERLPAPAHRAAPRTRTGALAAESLPLLGRDALLERIETALDDALRGRGGLVLLAGEAGVGKTRLLDALADVARARGARVARGASREAGGPAFAPWIEALESLFAASSDAEIAALAEGTTGAWLGELVHGLRDRLPLLALVEPGDRHGAESHWSLLGAVARALAASASTQPLVVLLDDLHWADAASLSLVEFLVRDLRHQPILLVGAHRDERFGSTHPVRSISAEAARLEAGAVLPVERLSEGDVGRLLSALVGGAPAQPLVQAVHARTAGNPFFVVQLARELASRLATAPGAWEAALESVPTAVRQVVSGRLARLDESARNVLALAAIAGAEFDVALAQRAWDRAPQELLDGLEDALAARLLEEVPGAPGRLRFVHALIHEAIGADLPGLRRARLHAAVGEALEALSAGEAEPPAAALAHHFREAVSVDHGARAAHWAFRAGDAALRRAAYQEAAEQYERAITLRSPAELEPGERFELLLSLGRARHLGLGDYVRARESFLAAAAVAREVGDAPWLAEAALAYAAIPQSSVPEVEEPCRVVLEEALAAQPPEAAKVRARLLARLAAFLANEPRRQEEAVTLARRALDTAHGVADARTTLEALLALARALRLQGRASPEERLAVATEAVALAPKAGEATLEIIARAQRIGPLLELGLVAEADAEVDGYAAVAERLRAPALLWIVPVLRAMQQLRRGELERVEATALSALPIAARVPGTIAPGVLAAQLFVLRREQGRLGEVEAPMRGLVERFSAVPGPRAWLSLLLSECDRREEARGELERFARDGLDSLVGTEGWRPSLAMLAEACAAVGDADLTQALYAELAPFEAHQLVLADGVLCLGPTARVLGVLAARLERWDDADAYFARALELCDAIASPPWATRTRLDYGRALTRRGSRRARARTLLRDAGAAASALGMVRVAEEARDLL